jgi:hypothetical protein
MGGRPGGAAIDTTTQSARGIMEIVLAILLGALFSWITLMIVVPLAGSLAKFSYPGWKEAGKKLAIIALVVNIIAAGLAPVSPALAWLVPLIVFWVLMYKWFDMNFIGAILIVVITWIVRMFLTGLIIAALGTASA